WCRMTTVSPPPFAPIRTGASCCFPASTRSDARCSRSRASRPTKGARMKTYSIAVLPGDGIGPEVIAQAVRVLEAVAERFDVRFALRTFPVGAAGVAAANEPLPQETRDAVPRSDAVLLGAVGDPAFDGAPRELRPETGLLALRKIGRAHV